MTIKYYQGAELPELKLWLLDDDASLIDFSSGYTFSLKVGRVGETAVVDKSSGITGAAGSGVAPSGTPNVTVAWVADDLDVDPGLYEWQLTATSGGLSWVFGGPFYIKGTL